MSEGAAEVRARPLRDLYLLLVIVASLALGSFGGYENVARMHRMGYAGDDAIYVQTLWNTAHGRLWRYSVEAWDGPIESAGERIHLSSHADLTHVVYLPFFGAFPRPETPLALEPVLVALGAIPLFLLARRRLGSGPLAAATAGLWLAYLPLVGNERQLVGVLLAAPLLLAALERLDAERLRAAAVFFALAFLTREDVVLPVAAFLLPLARDRKLRRFALAVSGAGLAWLFLYTAGKGAVFGPGPDHLKRFAALGGSLGAIALSPVLHPGVFFGRLLGGESLRLFFLLLLPLGLLPALAPRHLVAAFAPVALVAMSSVESDRILGRYLIASAPFLFAGLVVALEWVRARDRASVKPVVVALALAWGCTALAWTSDRAPFSAYAGKDAAGNVVAPDLRILSLSDLDTLDRITPESAEVRALAGSIPADASVSASLDVLLPLAMRRRLYPFPVRAREVDYVLVDTGLALWPEASREEHRRNVAAVDAETGAEVTRVGRFVLVKRRR